MSIIGATLINAIENGVKKQYDFKEVTNVQFVFNYLLDNVCLNYSGIKQDGSELTSSTPEKKIDRKDTKFRMLSTLESKIEKLIGCKPHILKLKINSKVMGFDCEAFFERDGKKIREVHLIKM